MKRLQKTNISYILRKTAKNISKLKTATYKKKLYTEQNESLSQEYKGFLTYKKTINIINL